MKTVQTVLFVVALFSVYGEAQAQQTATQYEAMYDLGDAYMKWREVRAYLPSDHHTTNISNFTYWAYYKSVYTYYGYNIYTGGTRMTSYDRMRAWAEVASDADYAYRWIVAGIERGVIPLTSRNREALRLIWIAREITQIAADEALEDFYDNYEF